MSTRRRTSTGSKPSYTPAGGFGAGDRQAPDTIVGFGEVRIRAETASIEVRASEVASPRQADQLISSSSVARPSSSRASPNGAIPTGWCGPRCTAGVSALVDLDGQGP
jgi:hypothetical protein